MVMVRFRSKSEVKDTIKRLKKMHKFTKELIECFEDKMEDDEYDDDEEDYRYSEEEEYDRKPEHMRGRYRRGMR